jgi:hypothetical protein
LAEAAATAAGSRGTVAMKCRLDIGFCILVSYIIASESQRPEPMTGPRPIGRDPNE